MKGRGKVTLYCSSIANANQVQASIDAWLSGKPGLRVRAPYIQDRPGRIAVIVDILFNSKAEAQALRDAVIDRWTNGANAARILPGSSIRVHVCRHDEGSDADCTVEDHQLVMK